MQANEKLKELESELLKLQACVAAAEGTKNFWLYLTESGEVEDRADGARVSRNGEQNTIAFPTYGSVAEVTHYYNAGMEHANRITVKSDIDFDAVIQSVKKLHSEFDKNGRAELEKNREKKKAEERKKLLDRLSEIDNNQPLSA